MDMHKRMLTGELWWHNPLVAFGLPLAFAGILAYGVAPSIYLDLWRTPKYFDAGSLVVVLSVVVLFSCGCYLGAARRRHFVITDEKQADWTYSVRWDMVRAIFLLSFILTLIGYSVWIVMAATRGLSLGAIEAVLRGASSGADDFREQYLSTIPGVTTATQFGLAVIVLGVPLGAATGWRGVRGPCVTVVALAVVRAFLNSERLAVIELIVPFAVSYSSVRLTGSRRSKRYAQAAPIFGVSLLYLFFASAEYFRSWSSYYAGRGLHFWSFIGARLVGYYATALNNGALLWRVSGPLQLHWYPVTLDFVWRFPMMTNVLPLFVSGNLSSAAASSAIRYAALLDRSANPELTNPSGVFAPLLDYSLNGGMLYWLVCGVICGYLYKQFRLKKVSGLFVYPIVYTSLIESPRIMYWSAGRCFPAMLVLIISVLFILPKEPSVAIAR